MRRQAYQVARVGGSIAMMAALLLTGNAGAAPSAPAATLFSQTDNPGSNWIESTNYQQNLQYDSLDSQGADDFVVPGNQVWYVSAVFVGGLYTAGSGSTVVDSVLVQLYSGQQLPTTRIYSTTIASAQVTSGLVSGEFLLTLPNAVTLPPGRYWLSVQANKVIDGPGGAHWWWRERTTQTGRQSAWRNPGGGYATPCSSQTFQQRLATCDHPAKSASPDLLFRIDGTFLTVDYQLYLPVTLR